MIKFGILALSCLVIEICSTFYIKSVSENNTTGMLFFSFVGPFLGLPFISYIIEATSTLERIKMALASGVGYVMGATIVIYIIK